MPISFVSKSKSALNAKTKARKTKFVHEVSMASLAASTSGELLPPMTLEQRAISSLKGLPKRVRKSDAAQVERVAKSIAALKQAAPVLIDKSGEIIAGHIVAQALQSLGEENAWCAVIEHLDEEERALLHVALNRLAETGDWDIEGLGALMVELDDFNFDLGMTGFSLPEIDILTQPGAGEDETLKDQETIEPPTEPVSILTDHWIMGKNSLLCGDGTKPESHAIVLDGLQADVVFTDCPWNLPASFISSQGKVKHSNFQQGAGEMSDGEFAAFADTFHALAAQHLVDGGVFYSCIDWRSHDVIVAAGKKAGLAHINTVVWAKGNGGMGSLYRSAHEFIVVFRKGTKLAVNNVELGKHGRDRSNVWHYPGANQKGSSANKALAFHPTAKLIELVEDALLDVSKRGAVVLDPFLGSDTTLLAAERSKRVACGIEIDPRYVDVAVRRWEAMTGKHAIHAQTGKTFAEVAIERASAAANLAS